MSNSKILQFPLRILGKVFQIIVLAYVYLPIILGIIYPMVFIIPIFYITGIIWINLGGWLSAYYLISSEMILLLLGIEIIIFFSGCSLFLVALIQLVQGKKQGDKLVQRGIYRYIASSTRFVAAKRDRFWLKFRTASRQACVSEATL